MPPRKKKTDETPDEAPALLTMEGLMASIEASGGIVKTQYSAFERIKTEMLSFNQALGGGIPMGLTTHIAGPTGSGKTTLAVRIGVDARKAGLSVAVVNQEFRWNPSTAYKSGMGIPGQDYLLFSFANGEEVLNTIVKLAKNGINIVIVDSVAAMPSRAEHESGIIGEGGAFGAMAKMWSEWFRVHSSTISNYNVALVLLNQYRTKMTTYGSPISRPGGKALEFYPAIALDLNGPNKESRVMIAPAEHSIESLMATDSKITRGINIRGETWKNVTGTNFMSFSSEILFLNGGAFFNWPKELAEWGKELGVFKNKEGNYLSASSHWYYDGIKMAESKQQAQEWLEDPANAQQVLKIKRAVEEAIEDGQ